MKTKPSPLTRSMNRSALRRGLLIIPLVLACVALSPRARAVCQDACLTDLNTVQGDDALISLTTGYGNTATGSEALENNTTGFDNTATGDVALVSNTTGGSNTAIGSAALWNNTTAYENTAVGVNALFNNTTGGPNTATGVFALYGNTTGYNNTANGFQTLFNNNGNNNTACGDNALYSNNGGDNNTASGYKALFRNTIGSNNIAIGYLAGSNLTTGSNNISIGDPGVAGVSNNIRIGRQGAQTATFIAGISGATVPTGVAVIVDSSGHLGTTTSSARFKEAIKPMEKSSEAIFALKPVTFRYKKELDPDCTPEFGLVAEDVEKVNPALVARDTDGKAYTVRYEAVNAMLLNEFLKEHHKVRELEAKLVKQEKDFTARLKEQDAKIQQVNDRVELSKPQLRTVLNNQ